MSLSALATIARSFASSLARAYSTQAEDLIPLQNCERFTLFSSELLLLQILAILELMFLAPATHLRLGFLQA